MSRINNTITIYVVKENTHTYDIDVKKVLFSLFEKLNQSYICLSSNPIYSSDFIKDLRKTTLLLT
jgi:hypothetical protein